LPSGRIAAPTWVAGRFTNDRGARWHFGSTTRSPGRWSRSSRSSRGRCGCTPAGSRCTISATSATPAPPWSSTWSAGTWSIRGTGW